MAGRRDKGQGSIMEYKRDGVKLGYHGRLVLPNGKRKDVYGKGKREVEQKLAQLRREVDGGLHGSTDGEMTVEAYLQSWYAAHAPGKRPKTQRGYADLMAPSHIGDIARLKLSEVKPAHIQNLYTAQLGQFASPTVHHLAAMLKLAFKAAVRLGILPRNPCDFAKAPSIKSDRTYLTLSREQVTALIQAAQDDPDGLMTVIGVTTGVRVEELLGIGWADLAADPPRVNLRHTMHNYPGDKFALELMKSATSRRTIPIQPYVWQMIVHQRAQQIDEAQRAGSAWSDAWSLLFRTPIGLPLKYDVPFRRMRSLMRRIGPPHFPPEFVARFRFHDLRHTFATLLIEDGVPIKVVSELLGHSGIGITLQTYSHVTPKMADTTSPVISAWLPEAPSLLAATVTSAVPAEDPNVSKVYWEVDTGIELTTYAPKDVRDAIDYMLECEYHHFTVTRVRMTPNEFAQLPREEESE